jgi:predicted  nucleic acid-binding Zn-ribbon protein
MISRIKGILAVDDNIEKVSNKIESLDTALSASMTDLASLRQELASSNVSLSELKKSSKGIFGKIDDELSVMRGSNDSLKKELYEFRLFRSELSEKLIPELTAHLKAEINPELIRLKSDVESFNKLKSELLQLTGSLKAIESDISKFREISREIKAADFRLADFAKEVCRSDTEKLRLLGQIDHLQNIVSKERRRPR